MHKTPGIYISSTSRDSSAQKVPMPGGERTDTKVPLIPRDVARWMMQKGTLSGDEHYAANISRLLKDNVVEYYEAELFGEIAEMEQSCKQKPTINANELVMQKNVGTEIGNIGQGGIGVQKTDKD